MGRSTSKPRKGHEHPKHLPKVGTPENLAWEHDGQRRRVFGTGKVAVVVGVVLFMVMVAWVALIL